MVFVEDVPDHLHGPADAALQALAKAVVATSQLLVAEGEVKALGSGMPLFAAVKASRSGIALTPEQFDGAAFGTEFGRMRRSDFPPGRGVLVQRGAATVVQVATPALFAANGEGIAPHSLVRA